jgi:hypothetical protein
MQAALRPPRSVRPRRNHRRMWIVQLVCSDPGCAEERELVVTDLDEADAAVCDCGCCLVLVSVANFEPLALATH